MIGWLLAGKKGNEGLFEHRCCPSVCDTIARVIFLLFIFHFDNSQRCGDFEAFNTVSWWYNYHTFPEMYLVRVGMISTTWYSLLQPNLLYSSTSYHCQHPPGHSRSHRRHRYHVDHDHGTRRSQAGALATEKDQKILPFVCRQTHK